MHVPRSTLLVLAAAAAMPFAACAPTASLAGTTTAAADTLIEPVRVASVPQVVDGDTVNVLDATLEVVYGQLPVPLTNGTSGPQWLRSYRLVSARVTPFSRDTTAYGVVAFPGPTFVFSPGDRVRIRLVNSLTNLPDQGNSECMSYPAASDSAPVRDTMPECFHGPNWTNIHYHGFHVTPDSTGDNVLLQIQPGRSFQYAFDIPLNQSPGTHWYHPHKHGSVAIQVANGMSGAFIIRGGGLDSLTDSMGIRERLLAVQNVDSTLNLLQNSPPRNSVKLINGQYRPVVRMYPGEVQRWRIVNENITKNTNFRIAFSDTAGDVPKMYDVARDGVAYGPANYSPNRPDPSLIMAPGNRLDVLVQAPRTLGVHHFSAVPVVDQHPERQSRQVRLNAAGGVKADTLFVVEVVAGTALATTLPSALPALPAFLANLPGPIADTAALFRDTASMPVIVFTDSGSSTKATLTPPQFWLGTVRDPQQQFNDTLVYLPTTSGDVARPMLLGQLQTWRVENVGQTTNHPFHIHINPFQVVYAHYPKGAADPNAPFYADLNRAAQASSPIWLDVIALPLPAVDAAGNVTDPGYVIIRQQYENFTGRYVMHCHILGHEERGMMQLLEVFPTAGAVQRTVPGGAHHQH